MNVLFLALDVRINVRTGEGIHVRELARSLGLLGHHIDLVTATPQREVPGIHPNVVHHLRPEGPNHGVVRFCAQLARRVGSRAIYERRLSPKVSWAVSVLTGLPYVVEVNGIEEEALLQGRGTPSFPVARRWMRRRFYQRAARVVVVTARLAALVREENRIPELRVRVVPNGVDTDRFAPMDPESARATIGFAPGPWIVFVGNLVVWQGVDTLIRAMPSVVREIPDVKLAIVGDGVLRGDLERLARRVAVGEHVHFLGSSPYELVPTHIGAASVCVAPFTRLRNERIGLSPLKVYEYLACGRPVVASDLPGIRETLAESHAGILVPPDDVDALGRAIVGILANEPERTDAGARGRSFAVAKCSWLRAAREIEGILEEATRRDDREPGEDRTRTVGLMW